MFFNYNNIKNYVYIEACEESALKVIKIDYLLENQLKKPVE
jgi:hypothetical protein